MDVGTTEEVKKVITTRFEALKFVFMCLLAESSQLGGVDFETVSIFLFKTCMFNERVNVDIIGGMFHRVLEEELPDEAKQEHNPMANRDPRKSKDLLCRKDFIELCISA